MTQPEARLSRKILTALRAQGIFAFKVHGSAYMTAGLPDIIGCKEGRFFGLETKMPDARDNVSPRQKFIHDQVRAAGGAVSVVCSVAEAMAFVQELDES